LNASVVSDLSSNMNGPSSTNKPKNELAPGPPFVHRSTLGLEVGVGVGVGLGLGLGLGLRLNIPKNELGKSRGELRCW